MILVRHSTSGHWSLYPWKAFYWGSNRRRNPIKNLAVTKDRWRADIQSRYEKKCYETKSQKRILWFWRTEGIHRKRTHLDSGIKNCWSTWNHHKHHFINPVPPFLTRRDLKGHQAFAYVRVHSRAVCIAACSSSFHLCATSFASGSSGFGAPKSACMERSIVRIWSAGDQLPDLGEHLVDKSWRDCLYSWARPNIYDQACLYWGDKSSWGT